MADDDSINREPKKEVELDFDVILDQFRDGELDGSGHAKLIEHLGDPTHARWFAERYLMDEHLGELVGSGQIKIESTEFFDDEHPLDSDGKPDPVVSLASSTRSARTRRRDFNWNAGWTLGLFAVSTLLLVGVLYKSWLPASMKDGPEPIAVVTGASGFLEWTAANGQINSSPEIGTSLVGGTIEGMTPESWFELTFEDGTQVTISGRSSLTFAELGQKKLHLRKGALFADVKPQPAEKPLLVLTRTASMEVVGTRFNVDAESLSTTLNVNSGKVRIQKTGESKQLEVSSGFRAVAELGKELQAVPLPQLVNRWKSRIDRDGEGTLGRWFPPSNKRPAELAAVPYIIEDGRTIFAVGCGVSYGNGVPVKFDRNSKVRLRGNLEKASPVFVGITVRKTNGDFGGRFQTVFDPRQFEPDSEIELEARLDDFQLDPALWKVRDRLAPSPKGMVVESVWCHTLFKPAGLKVSDFEILTPKGETRSPVAESNAARAIRESDQDSRQ